MNALFILFLLTFFGAINYFFVGDLENYGAAQAQGLLIVNLLQLGAGALAIATIFSSATAKATLRRSAPLLGICALAIASALWSPDPYMTVRKAMALTTMALMAMAIVDRVGVHQAIRCLIASMTIACVLSIVAVIVSPSTAVHQATDSFQSVHAGLWRGVLAHKVSLGIFSGLLIALAITADTRHAPLPLRLVAGVSGLTCLIGSGSASGLVTTAVYVGIHLCAKWIAGRKPERRGALSFAFAGLLVLLGYFFFSGDLDRWAVLVGRQPDLTGRATYWPHVIEFVRSYAPTVGFGYGAGYRFIGPLLESIAGTRLTEAHNGLLEMLVAFGYLGTTVVSCLVVLLLWRALKLVRTAPRDLASVSVFPLTAMATNILTSYAESIILMPAGVWTIVFMFSIAILCRLEEPAQTKATERPTARPRIASPFAVASR
jgi:O-antigen ligase